MKREVRSGDVIAWRGLDPKGNPVGDPLAVRYTSEGKVVVRPRSESAESSSREETRAVELIAPANPLAESVARLLPLFEKWLQKQVGQVETEASVGEPSKPEKEWYTPEEVANLFHLHVQTVMAWCREGKLDAVKIGGNDANGKGGRYLIPRESIDAYLHKQRRIHGQRRRNAK